MADRGKTAERNLILVHRKGWQDIADFHRIRDLIAERAPDIEVFIACTDSPCSVTRRHAARRPTLVFAPTALQKFRPARGRIFCGRRILKTAQIRALQGAGVSVPDAVVIERDTRLDPATWGPFTVLKPEFGLSGGGVRLVRTRDVGWVDPSSWPRHDPRHGYRMLAQKFIDTGRHPSKYRLLALFGRALYCNRVIAAEPLSLPNPNEGTPIEIDVTVKSSGPSRLEATDDADVLALGPAVAKVFPDVPVLGLDIVREEKTGKLYVLEVNPNGATWHLSSVLGKKMQAEKNLNFYQQFDALSVAADALIEKTRAEAE